MQKRNLAEFHYVKNDLSALDEGTASGPLFSLY